MPALNAISPDTHAIYLAAVPVEQRCACPKYGDNPCVSAGWPELDALCPTCSNGCTEVILICNEQHVHHQHVQAPRWAQ